MKMRSELSRTVAEGTRVQHACKKNLSRPQGLLRLMSSSVYLVYCLIRS